MFKIKTLVANWAEPNNLGKVLIYLVKLVTFSWSGLRFHVFSRTFLSTDQRFALGLLINRAKKWFSNNGPLCMITSDEQISPPSLVCKENSLQMHSLCTGVLLKFTASGIHLRKTSRWNLLTWRKYSQELLHHFKVWVFGKMVNVSFQIRAQNMQQFLF